jgi:hypothetical protein
VKPESENIGNSRVFSATKTDEVYSGPSLPQLIIIDREGKS